jgi:peptidoglycan/LPS O-acetylase OafA/YrhL
VTARGAGAVIDRPRLSPAAPHVPPPDAGLVAAPRRPNEGRPSFRADIQGLRGIAVLLVVLCHSSVPHASGGFVGVDVFFVISGFLITQWLLGRAAAENRVPFAAFYATRARRILPAAALTLIATCAASWYASNYVRAMETVHDVVWATFFAANIHFAAVSTDYFAQDNPPSPVQQFWTLAVEEQFYVVWPLLIGAALLFVGWRRRGFDATIRARLTILVAVVIIASFAWSVEETRTHPQAAYFSTFARAWELGTGALLTLALPAIVRVGGRTRALMTWAGVVGIVVAAVAYDGATRFPGEAALLPVLATALAIAGGAGSTPRYAAAMLLGLRPLRIVGDVSYSFYLWHWPVLVLGAAYLGRDLSVEESLSLVGAAFGLSYVTYRLFENPVRHARRLRSPRAALCLWPSSVTAVLAMAMLVSSSIAVPPAAIASLSVGGGSSGSAGDPTALPSATSAEVRAAVAASVTRAALRSPIPDALAPSVDKLRGDDFDMQGCVPGDGTTSRICRWGARRSPRKMVVLGDSHGQMWMPAFVRFATAHRWRLIPLVKIGCVPSLLGSGACGKWYSWALQQIRRIHPRAIVVAQFWSAWGPSGVHAMRRELADVMPLARRVIVVEDAPPHPKPAVDCLLAPGATRGSCTYGVTAKEAHTYADVHRAVVDARARYVRTKQWLCHRGKCPTVVGNIIAYRDRHHITLTYMRFLTRPLAHRVWLAVG